MCFAPTRRSRGDAGETLVEILAAVVIMGITGVAVLTGLMLSVKASDIHRKGTTSSAYVRSFAEAIEDYVAAGHYQNCAGKDVYKVPAVMNRLTDLDSDTSFEVTQLAAKSVGPNGVAASGCASDTGVQQITLSVESKDGRAAEQLVVVLRKPCGFEVGSC